MKIIILSALKDWIINKFGIEQWKTIAEKMGIGVAVFNNQDSFLADARFQSLIQTIIEILTITEDELKENSISYWLVDFAPRVYQSYTKKIETTKVFLINIIKLNNEICRLLPNKSLYKVDMQEMNEASLTLIYASEKSLVDVVGLLRGASSFFNDTYTIKKINAHSVEIKFERK